MTSAARPTGPRGAAIDLARSFAPVVPPGVLAAFVIGGGDLQDHGWAAFTLAAVLSLVLVAAGRARLSRKLSTVSSVLEAFRGGDFSIRARATPQDSLLGAVVGELNHLGDTLRSHRLGEMEAWTLLRKVMAEADVVLLAVDEAGHIKLANDVAARVLGHPSATLLGKTAAELGVADLLVGPAPRVVRDSAVLGGGPWELRRGAFRLSGEPHSLVVLSDVGSALREQEREAWKRLIRVMGHEINNSLAPIHSISDNLRTIVGRSPRPEGWEEDVASGLSVIARRSEALGRFLAEYAKLARLPAPRRAPVVVSAWIGRAAALEQRLRVEVTGGPETSIQGDSDQLDQLLINLVKNAADATLEKGGAVRVGWEVVGETLRVAVADDGPGPPPAANLFVPFFTTKPGGSGIGLVLARQIAEAHGGELRLETGPKGGATALVRLPIAASPQS